MLPNFSVDSLGVEIFRKNTGYTCFCEISTLRGDVCGQWSFSTTSTLTDLETSTSTGFENPMPSISVSSELRPQTQLRMLIDH